MNVISISTDRKMFEEGSAVRERMIQYGSLFVELHIVVFSKEELGLEAQRISDNVWIYPTNSWTKYLYMYHAIRKAKEIVEVRQFTPESTYVTAQDPFETGKVALRLHQQLKFPLQIQVHTDLFTPYFKNQSFLNKIRFGWARNILLRAGEIRVVSNRIKQGIIQEFGVQESKIDVLPIYTETEKFDREPTFNLQEKYPKFNFIILMVSRLALEKNIPFALAVFKEILEKDPRAGLVIVGDGPEESNLRAKVSELGITDSVIFEPWQNDVVSYYKTAHAFLHTSLYEGYGLVLYEAARAGMPIVTSDVGIAGDVLVHNRNACVCPINDKKCFVDNISRIISDNSFRQILKTTILEDLAHTGLPNYTTYLAEYKRLMAKSRSEILLQFVQ